MKTLKNAFLTLTVVTLATLGASAQDEKPVQAPGYYGGKQSNNSSEKQYPTPEPTATPTPTPEPTPAPTPDPTPDPTPTPESGQQALSRGAARRGNETKKSAHMAPKTRADDIHRASPR